MLKLPHLEKLQASKNLLAFSGGGDSTALFFLLIEYNISFDIAIVDYRQREQSKEEVSYAQELAKRYNLKCFTHNAVKIDSNFEANARKIRYNFFETLIQEHNYTNLLTAHHLGDRFEWMLMQLCKGAGCLELSGMKTQSQRENYTLLRPLLHLDKSELITYLQTNKILYFNDASNSDEKYQRNYFRNHHTTPLLEKYLAGIKKSFQYIDEDSAEIIQEITLYRENEWAYFKSSTSKRSDIYHIDKYLKEEGYLISSSEKTLLKDEKTVIVARKIVVNQEHDYVFIMPFVKEEKMPKELKKKCEN